MEDMADPKIVKKVNDFDNNDIHSVADKNRNDDNTHYPRIIVGMHFVVEKNDINFSAHAKQGWGKVSYDQNMKTINENNQ